MDGIVDIDTSIVDITAINGNASVTSGNIIDINATGDVNITGGTGDNASAGLHAATTVNITTTGDLTVQSGSGANSDAFIQADSPNTINIDAQNVAFIDGGGTNSDAFFLSGNGEGAINITADTCTNCDSINLTGGTDVGLSGNPITLNLPPVPEPPVEPAPEEVITPMASEPLPLLEPEPVAIEPEIEIPDSVEDIINTVVALVSNNSEDETEDEKEIDLAATTEEEEEETENSAGAVCTGSYAAS